LDLPPGTTSCQVAAFHGHGDVLRILLAAEAAPNAADAEGKTALLVASNKAVTWGFGNPPIEQTV
jgi:ankyrin repeat protein